MQHKVGVMHKCKGKYYITFINLFMFLLCCIHTNERYTDNSIHFNTNTKNGTVLSFLNHDNSKNSLNEKENGKNKDIFVVIINSNRLISSLDKDFYFTGRTYNFENKKTSTALAAYIQNHACNRVIHPSLYELQSFII